MGVFFLAEATNHRGAVAGVAPDACAALLTVPSLHQTCLTQYKSRLRCCVTWRLLCDVGPFASAATAAAFSKAFLTAHVSAKPASPAQRLLQKLSLTLRQPRFRHLLLAF